MLWRYRTSLHILVFTWKQIEVEIAHKGLISLYILVPYCPSSHILVPNLCFLILEALNAQQILIQLECFRDDLLDWQVLLDFFIVELERSLSVQPVQIAVIVCVELPIEVNFKFAGLLFFQRQ